MNDRRNVVPDRGVSKDKISSAQAECRVLERGTIEALIEPLSVIAAVEQGYLEQSQGAIKLLESVYVDTGAGIFAIKSAIGPEYLVIKQASLFAANSASGLPNLQSVVSVFNAANGSPNAILLDQGVLTNHRTAAAGAIGAKHLSRPDSTEVLLIGAGGQAGYQLEYLTHVRDIKSVHVFSNNPRHTEEFVVAARLRYPCLNINACSSVEEGLATADIVVTCTPSKLPLFKADRVRAGVHINAIGSDRPGKQELDPELLLRARYVADNAKQCAKVGELQHVMDPLLQERVVSAEVADLIGGERPGRESPQEITIFDSTGLASQDYAIAKLLCEALRP